MKEGVTFSMPAARGRYLISAALVLALTVAALYVPLLVILASALQGLLFRLSRPMGLAFLPAAIAALICLAVELNPLAMLPAVTVLLVGVLMRVAQIKRFSKNVSLLLPALVLALVIILLVALMLEVRYGGVNADAVKSFLSDVRAFAMGTLDDYLSMSPEMLSAEERLALVADFEVSLQSMLLLAPSMIALLLFLSSYLIYALYRLTAKLLRMKDGLPDSGWHLSLSLPFAIFYLLLFVLSLFISGTNALSLSVMNLRVFLTFFIALIGARSLSTVLAMKFRRASSRLMLVMIVSLLLFSSFSLLLWSALALGYAIRVTFIAFRKKGRIQF